jgi:hypothetical protein
MQDRRKCRRRRTYLSGRIAFNSRFSIMDCLIRNVSHDGALLEFAGPVVPPHEADLCFLSRGESRRARLIWCRGGRAGYAVDAPRQNAVVSIETARLIRSLKADRAALAKRIATLVEPM